MHIGRLCLRVPTPVTLLIPPGLLCNLGLAQSSLSPLWSTSTGCGKSTKVSAHAPKFDRTSCDFGRTGPRSDRIRHQCRWNCPTSDQSHAQLGRNRPKSGRARPHNGRSPPFGRASLDIGRRSTSQPQVRSEKGRPSPSLADPGSILVDCGRSRPRCGRRCPKVCRAHPHVAEPRWIQTQVKSKSARSSWEPALA